MCLYFEIVVATQKNQRLTDIILRTSTLQNKHVQKNYHTKNTIFQKKLGEDFYSDSHKILSLDKKAIHLVSKKNAQTWKTDYQGAVSMPG